MPAHTQGSACWLRLATLFASLLSSVQASELRVETSSGVVQGIYNNTAETVRAFLGVPYAEPPIGDLRWVPPVLKSYSNSTLSADGFGPLCPSQDSYGPGSVASILPYLPWGDVMSEDCLQLNIWAPASKHQGSEEPAAVMMFIHGGAFTGGGSSIAYFDGTDIVQDNNNIIVVTINYRLDVFGFPNAPGLLVGEQNVGILDQRMAVEWVQKNIAKFGGDPSRIMLFGQSAGAAATDIYTYAFYDDPIIHAAAMESGTAGLLTSNDVSQNTWKQLSNALGCTATDPAANLACMRALPFEIVLNETFAGLYVFFPVQDNIIVFSDYNDRASQGKIANIPTLMGTNEREASVNNNANSNPIDEALVAVLTQIPFQCPAAHSSILRVENNIPIWRYIYHGNWTDISPFPSLGAYHSSELPIIFGTYWKAGGPFPPEEVQASKYMQGAWVSFAQDPQSLSTKYGWPQHRLTDRLIVNLALNNAVNASYGPAAQWDKLCGIV